MSDNIDNRPIEEIKARLDFCRNVKMSGDCMSCPYVEDADVCASDFMFDSFDYMQHLETELAEARKDVDILGEQVVALDGAYNAMKRERDAAVRDMRDATLCGCHVCKHYYRPDVNVRIYACRKFGEFGKFDYIKDDGSMFCGAFEWRGIQEVSK